MAKLSAAHGATFTACAFRPLFLPSTAAPAPFSRRGGCRFFCRRISAASDLRATCTGAVTCRTAHPSFPPPRASSATPTASRRQQLRPLLQNPRRSEKNIPTFAQKSAGFAQNTATFSPASSRGLSSSRTAIEGHATNSAQPRDFLSNISHHRPCLTQIYFPPLQWSSVLRQALSLPLHDEQKRVAQNLNTRGENIAAPSPHQFPLRQ